MSGRRDRDGRLKPVLRRLLWFVFLWLAGVGTLAAAAYLLRLPLGL